MRCEAGFDGVEIHGANGYLLDQFAKDGANKRTDAYGGSIENRARLMLEVSKAVAAEAGAEPHRHPHLAGDAGQRHLRQQSAAAVRLHRRRPQRAEARLSSMSSKAPPAARATSRRSTTPPCASASSGTYIANNGYDFELATKVLAATQADLIAFGKPFISNPDLVERLKRGAPLNEWDKATFYGGGAKGYTDYPTLGEPRTRRVGTTPFLRRHCRSHANAEHPESPVARRARMARHPYRRVSE